ncbi:MAG: GNAT family N-acetyltransferase [Solobacterium sp.]|nr:GNAT family N-acetyltransferase [Solobacterium sp.]
MEIRNLTKDERSDALILAGKVLFEENGSWSEEEAKQILSFLQEYTEDFDMLGVFEDRLRGVLIYEPESLRIVFLATAEDARHEKHAVSLLDEIMERGRKMHLPRIRLNAALSARAFYEAYGFEVCGEASESEGLRFVPMEYLLQKEWLGRTVTVITDRPYGSFHPHLPDVLYPVNYGYIRELAVQEGMFQDAYIIGPTEPVEEFTGIVTGIVYRKDDEVSRWIVTPAAAVYSHEAIISLIGFEEQYYDCRILWADENRMRS